MKDRHDRDFVIQPTSEEVITDIARQELRSYKQLPRNFYHIQTKFRDERRPRFGVMRGREFTMKDAYSFDRDFDAGAQQLRRDATAPTARSSTAWACSYRAVAADTGAIGGDAVAGVPGHRRHRRGRHRLLPDQRLRGQHRTGRRRRARRPRAAPAHDADQDADARQGTCEDVAELLGLPLARTVKSLVLATDEKDDGGDIAKTHVWLLLVRGDHDLNEVKAGKVAGLKAGFRFATVGRDRRRTSAASPATWGRSARASRSRSSPTAPSRSMSDFVCGANDADFHYTGVNWGRDLPEPDVVADIRNVVAGDPSPDGKGVLAIQRGIEVGHVFLLGTKYSDAMNATYLDETGKPQPFVMGCYGIGVTRLLGAAIEQNHDERGIVWPAAMAPFGVVLCPIGYDRSADGQGRRRPRCTTSWRPPASTCCSTTAASAPARCSPTGN